MTLHLAETNALAAPGARAVVTLDEAGWHKLGGLLVVPSNISLRHLHPRRT